MPNNGSPQPMKLHSRPRIRPVDIPVSIATLFDFGDLKIDENNSNSNLINYVPTKHILYCRDFEKIMNQTAMQYQIRNKKELVLNREFRVRIKAKDGSAKFWNIISLKILDVESKIVEFRWKSTSQDDSDSSLSGHDSNVLDTHFKEIGNIFGV